ncbi:hypothetical protein [uncultured Roseobacter sp.]|uniref:hypothetical protein n=1 Tax=uncultured Roseobacter sp. TaxID=114847 RepID=UPI002616FC37|nr:hypothetical protein [uncultured Roseobacter sp.]
MGDVTGSAGLPAKAVPCRGGGVSGETDILHWQADREKIDSGWSDGTPQEGPTFFVDGGYRVHLAFSQN